jgi:hypothetical protein
MRKDRTQGRWAAFIRSFPAMSPRLARHLPSAAGLFLLGVPILIYLTRDNGHIARLGFRPHAPKLDLLAALLQTVMTGAVRLMAVRAVPIRLLQVPSVCR